MLVADITIDTRAMPKGEIMIDLDAPFDAHQFYIQMRHWGLNPFASNDGVYCGCNGPIERKEVFSWAHAADPDRSIRDEYARAALDRRTFDEEIIPLGVATPFDAHSFYVSQRAMGMNPRVTETDIHFGPAIKDDAKQQLRQASQLDPHYVMRRTYAQSVWQSRPASDLRIEHQFVPLGV
jgi:hypothetical protein